jgi:hypothetical protein
MALTSTLAIKGDKSTTISTLTDEDSLSLKHKGRKDKRVGPVQEIASSGEIGNLPALFSSRQLMNEFSLLVGICLKG